MQKYHCFKVAIITFYISVFPQKKMYWKSGFVVLFDLIFLIINSTIIG